MAVVSPLAKYKLVFLGDQKVGKTSIIIRFIRNVFDTIYEGTVGIEFFSKTMYVEDITVRLQIWDTSGHMRFRSLIPTYIRDSSAAVIVYDVANRESFLNTSEWIELVRKEQGNNVIIVFVGNKNDHDVERQVSIEEGDAKARKHGAMFTETSAKAGFNIKPLFIKIAFALPKMGTLSSTIHDDMVDDSTTNDESRKAEDIPDIAPVVMDCTDHGIPKASHQTAPTQTTDTMSSKPSSVSFTHISSESCKPIMTIEELGPWLVESMTLLANALHVQLPPLHYGQASSVLAQDIPSTSTCDTHDDVGRSKLDATTTPHTDDPHD